jgi:hypothetical protein
MAAPDAIERSLCSASIDGGKRSLWVNFAVLGALADVGFTSNNDRVGSLPERSRRVKSNQVHPSEKSLFDHLVGTAQ